VRLKIRLKFEDTKIIKNLPVLLAKQTNLFYIFFEISPKGKRRAGIDFLRREFDCLPKNAA